MEIPTHCLLDPEGNLTQECRLDPALLVRGYQTMSLARAIDDRMIILQRQGTITFAMSALGEEACSVAAASALDLADWIYPQYRESGVMFWRGCTAEEYIHHMFGNAKDLILGRQMPNHFGSRKLNVVTVSSPIGTKIPHAAGCAYGMALKKEKSVALCFFGEGATSEGDFHVGLRFAAVYKVPAIFFCRNNGWAISTPASCQFATDGVALEGIGHGLETFRVDGNDFLAVHEVVARAKSLCLEGKGPIFIEAMTKRLGAHSTSDDPSRYRNEEEIREEKKLCPIKRLRLFLEQQNLWDDAREKEMHAKIKEEIDQAIESAKNTPHPPLKSMIEGVWFEPTEALKKEFREILP